ncbi:MAG TPA: two-component regulator propeller domain-containing protein, partial [Candidatus Binatia bacterium]|nr:two-component regulator propeller domain-containing protein [Candidatus Binatia bacterium]
MKAGTLGLSLSLLLAAALRLGSQVSTLVVENVMANAPPLQMEIHAVLLDRRGFLWIGSQNGLARYDGYRVIPSRLNEVQDPTVADPSVRGICEDGNGRLWLATAHGLVRHDPGTGTSVRFRSDPHRADTLSSDDLTCLVISPALPNRLLVASAAGDLDELDLADDHIVRLLSGPAAHSVPRPGRIRVISGDPSGFIFVGAENGLYRFLPLEGRLQFCRPPDDVSGTGTPFVVTAIFYADGFRDALWVGSEAAGLFRYFPATGLWQRTAEQGPAGIQAIAAYPGEPLDLLIGMENGLVRFAPRQGRFRPVALIFNITDLQASQCTRVISRDRLGTFWIGSCQNGLDKWSPTGKKFSRYKPFDAALPNPMANWVTSMQELADSDIVLTTVGGGAWIFNRQRRDFRRLWLDPARPERELNATSTSSAIDGDGTLWFTTAEGLARCSADGRLQHLYRYSVDKNGQTGFLVFAYSRDRAGRHWLGSDQGLMVMDLERNEVRRFRHERTDQNSLSHDRVNALLTDGDTLWIGTDDGLNLFRPGRGAFSIFRSDPADPGSLSSNQVMGIERDSLGRIWICTAKGLNLLSREGGRVRFRRFLMPGIEPRQNSFLSMIEENSRHFWLGSKAGLARFDSERGTFTFYDRRDGVVADGLDEAFFFFRSLDNEFFFGGRDGFTAFRPSAFALNLHPPPLVVTDLRIEQDLGHTDSLRLNGKKNVRVELAALDFVRPEKNQYAYFLEGRDRDWTYQGTDRVVLLAALPVGLYTLRAKAANNDGIWNDEGISIKVRVRPPFWEQYGPAVLAAGLLAVLAAFVFWSRRRSRRLRAAALPENLDPILEKYSISKREAEIVRLLLVGKSNREIEDALFIAMATV